MILQQIAERTKQRYKDIMSATPLEEMKKSAEKQRTPSPFAFEKALKQKDMAFICEVKKASPSKGIISENFDYKGIAREYEIAGANAVSVLTEPYYFMGSDSYLTQIKQKINIPVLRKDFTLYEYQIYEASLIGADAVLLICALLDTNTIKHYINVADSLGISCVVEAHSEAEVYSALEAKARIIGVNNRNLKTFEVDLSNSISLRKLVPSHIIFVAESGIQTAQDVKKLRENSVDAVLIGETLMKSDDIALTFQELRGRSS